MNKKRNKYQVKFTTNGFNKILILNNYSDLKLNVQSIVNSPEQRLLEVNYIQKSGILSTYDLPKKWFKKKIKINHKEESGYKDVEKMFDEALKIVKDNIGKDKLTRHIYRPITINTRAKHRWGRCTCSADGERARIEISGRILRNEVPDKAVMEVLIHEILHACKDGTDHTGPWKRYANTISRNTQYKITRTTSASTFNLEEEQQTLMRRYAVKCTCCNKVYYKSRLTNVIKHPEWYRCGVCKNKLERSF